VISSRHHHTTTAGSQHYCTRGMAGRQTTQMSQRLTTHSRTTHSRMTHSRTTHRSSSWHMSFQSKCSRLRTCTTLMKHRYCRCSYHTNWTCTNVTGNSVNRYTRRDDESRYLAKTVRETGLENLLSRCCSLSGCRRGHVSGCLQVGLVLNHCGGYCVHDSLGLLTKGNSDMGLR
jgi:hypothetical protein